MYFQNLPYTLSYIGELPIEHDACNKEFIAYLTSWQRLWGIVLHTHQEHKVNTGQGDTQVDEDFTRVIST